MEKIELFQVKEDDEENEDNELFEKSDNSDDNTPQTRRAKQSFKVVQDKVMSNVQIFKEDLMMVTKFC